MNQSPLRQPCDKSNSLESSKSLTLQSADFELNLSSNSMESLQEANLVDSAADHKKEVYDDGTRDRSGKKLKNYKKPRCPRKNQTRQNKLRVIRIKIGGLDSKRNTLMAEAATGNCEIKPSKKSHEGAEERQKGDYEQTLTIECQLRVQGQVRVEQRRSPHLKIKGLSKVKGNQLEVQCLISTYKFKTVIFKVRAEQRRSPHLKIIRLSKNEDNQLEVECLISAYKFRTVSFKFIIDEDTPDYIAGEMKQANFLKGNHKKFFKAEIRRVCGKTKTKIKSRNTDMEKLKPDTSCPESSYLPISPVPVLAADSKTKSGDIPAPETHFEEMKAAENSFNIEPSRPALGDAITFEKKAKSFMDSPTPVISHPAKDNPVDMASPKQKNDLDYESFSSQSILSVSDRNGNNPQAFSQHAEVEHQGKQTMSSNNNQSPSLIVDHKKEVYNNGTGDRSGNDHKVHKKPPLPKKNCARQRKLRIILIKVGAVDEKRNTLMTDGVTGNSEIETSEKSLVGAEERQKDGYEQRLIIECQLRIQGQEDYNFNVDLNVESASDVANRLILQNVLLEEDRCNFIKRLTTIYDKVRAEQRRSPQLKIIRLSKNEDNQVEVECLISTYNFKTVTFKFIVDEDTPDYIAGEMMQENFLKENHKEFFKAEIRRVCVEAKKKYIKQKH
ncbi:unnamed protein product [Clavelina lepadiformis]|uniref:Serine/threonine-protein kinase WNK CCTL2 domain-containing protein n=1 Tax=Clavelina lepadiformis TaxID=159417 RepID=A0ABP0FYL4_CLALP